MKAKFLLFIFLFSAGLIQAVFPAPLFEKGMIKGEIFDSTANIPIPYANILLYHQKDTSFVGGTASGTTGEFILTNITEGTYFLKVNHLGYSIKYVPGIIIIKEHGDFYTGTIKLSKNTLELQGIQVTGEKPEQEFLLDKKVINQFSPKRNHPRQTRF